MEIRPYAFVLLSEQKEISVIKIDNVDLLFMCNSNSYTVLNVL